MSDSESSDEDTDRQVEEEDALKTELPPEKVKIIFLFLG